MNDTLNILVRSIGAGVLILASTLIVWAGRPPRTSVPEGQAIFLAIVAFVGALAFIYGP